MKFDFSFGKKKKTLFQWATISLVLTSIVVSLHQCTGISEKNIWRLIDEIQREVTRKGYLKNSDLNDYIIQTPKLLEQRIQSDVNYAIDEYEREEQKLYVPRMKNKEILKEIETPKYTETQRQIVKDAIYYECSPDGSEAQELLGGAQGIHSAWYHSKECNY